MRSSHEDLKMNNDFPRILTLLRKEKSISQKKAAEYLNVSQALLSHYEKGIRECGLDFLKNAAVFYGVSCDYLLGLSPERNGATIKMDDIPDTEAAGRDNNYKAGVLQTLNKKLIVNSLNILFSFLAKLNSKALTNEISAFLMIAVYKMFRTVHGANGKNKEELFAVPMIVASGYSDAAMKICEANILAMCQGSPVADGDNLQGSEDLVMSTESLSAEYPLFASSLMHLIQSSEQRIGSAKKPGKKNAKAVNE